MKDLFKPEHLYGRILQYMYNQPDKRFDLTHLQDQFKGDATYLATVLRWLTSDTLIVEDEDFTVPIYRISYTGFRFIRELEDSYEAKRNALWANRISISALIVSAIALIWDLC